MKGNVKRKLEINDVVVGMVATASYLSPVKKFEDFHCFKVDLARTP
jgi:hypothetical protein